MPLNSPFMSIQFMDFQEIHKVEKVPQLFNLRILSLAQRETSHSLTVTSHPHLSAGIGNH